MTVLAQPFSTSATAAIRIDLLTIDLVTLLTSLQDPVTESFQSTLSFYSDRFYVNSGRRTATLRPPDSAILASIWPS